MAVCGRCLICGYKFNGRRDDGTEPDMGVRWECTCQNPECERSRAFFADAYNEVKEHKICATCVNCLVTGELDGAVADMVALLARRREN